MESNLETSQDSAQKKITFDDLSRDELLNKCKGLLLIAQKAKQAKSDLLNELENHKIQLSTCEAEKKVSHENINTLQELVNSLTEQKLNYITEIDAAHSKIKILSEKCNINVNECQKLKTDLSEKENTIIELSQKQSDLDSEIVSLKRQNNRLLEENEQLINQLTELEARSTEFNDIGLQQREQLTILEQKVQADNIIYTNKLEELNNTIKELENRLHLTNLNKQVSIQLSEYEGKINELTQLYESEKNQKEKANLKLKTYKDKILKCAACINQLKNARFILTKTVKEYSEIIPKWQSDIIKASKIMDKKINESMNENSILKDKLQQLQSDLNELDSQKTVILQQSNSKSEENKVLSDEISLLNQQIHDLTNSKTLLKGELHELKLKYDELKNSLFPSQLSENKLLRENLNELNQKLNDLTLQNENLNKLQEQLKSEKNSIINLNDKETVENLMLQIKALESEKAILVKEKLNARDNLSDVESQNKILSEQVLNLRLENENIKSKLQTLTQEKHVLEEKYKSEKYIEVDTLKCLLTELQMQYDLLKKDHNNILDLNGLLKEEVDTLKLSLEQPKDEAENLSDLNVSLQADIVKLETKLSAYKQENNSLLTEVKESRAKIKEYDSLVADYETAKSKLSSYKTENTELLTEMKEINQVLKERGEAISKMQKAIDEMELLIETLEKDRDNLKHEKEELLKRIETLETDLKKAERKKSEDNEEIEKKITEKETALKYSAQKDDIIAALKEEIEKLKQQQSAPELPNEDMSTSTISKAEDHSRMKDLDETFEEKYTKLRIFALKLKKKLNDTITQLQNAEQDKAKLEKIINENELTIKQAHVTADEVDFKVENEKSLNVLQISDLEAKVKSLTTAVTSSEKISAELVNIKAELAERTSQLTAEIEAHKITKDNLEKAQRDVKKKNVLSLEMEDYERSMKELTNKMEEYKKKMVQMESTIDTQEGTITTMKTQIKLLEEQIKAEETQNRLVKEELQLAIEVRKERDDMIALKNDIISKLEQDLEDIKRNKEEAILEITSLLTEKEKVVISLSEDKAELNNKLKRMEFKCGELNEKLRILNIELEDLKAEYTSYKVRAQAVLRQNQTIDHSQEEQLKEEMAALRAQVEALTTKLTTAEERCAEAGTEVESSRRRVAEAGAEAARAQQRTARLHADLARLTQQMDSERAQHKLQVSTLTQCYKTQISELEMKHQKEKEELNKQLVAARENAKLGEAVAGTVNRSAACLLPATGKDDGSDGEMDINVSMIPREEGEGSEAAPSPPPLRGYASSAAGGADGRRSPVPLERLLEEGVPDDEALPGAAHELPPDQELADLRRKLHSQHQRVKHVTLLLAESEREGARLAQLSELLKAELRRVRGASHHAHNTEYMKNVTLKFLTLPPGDERSRLVPVLQKILTLTNDETHKIQAIAKGLDPNPSKGWGSYLPWPGGK